MKFITAYKIENPDPPSPGGTPIGVVYIGPCGRRTTSFFFAGNPIAADHLIEILSRKWYAPLISLRQKVIGWLRKQN